jgi:hypothetical protein
MERLKILLMGDASNCHAALAGTLARQGHEVTLASAGSGFMKTSSPVSLRRPLPGKAGGLLLWLRLRRLLRSDLRGHDIVSICGPGFVDLRPARIRPVFDALRRDNGAVFMTHLGLDALYAADCLSAAAGQRFPNQRAPVAIRPRPPRGRAALDCAGADVADRAYI